MIWTFFTAQSWVLWTTRNKFTIEKKIPQQPANCVFKCLLNLQLWHPLQKSKDLLLMEEMETMTKNLFQSTHVAPPTSGTAPRPFVS
jgi:hypothetical protein